MWLFYLFHFSYVIYNLSVVAHIHKKPLSVYETQYEIYLELKTYMIITFQDSC